MERKAQRTGNGIKEALRKAGAFALETAAETLWPTRCAICDAPGEVLCGECESDLRFVDACKACPACGAPYGATQCTECNSTIMASIGRERLPMDKMAHCIVLDDRSRRLITVYKDQGEQRLAGFIAAFMNRYIPPEWLSGKCRITYIPATEEALRRRGFDHMRNIAEELSALTGLRLCDVFAPPASSDQRKLSRRRRIENMSSTIKLAANCDIPRECILIDDVCTTGSTLFAAADALKDAGCEKVYALTFGRVLDI